MTQAPPQFSAPTAPAASPSSLTPLSAYASEADRAALARMRALSPRADPGAVLGDVPPSRIPRHVAIIMDGNGRWARARGLPRGAGHTAGAPRVRDLVTEIVRLGIEVLTLYSFSIENWKRPEDEIQQLMALYLKYMDAERSDLVKNNIRFRQIGRREGLPESALGALDRTLSATARCTGPTLCLAVNYGSRAEITDAVRTLAARARAGEIDPAAIDEGDVSAALGTAGLPDPDLLIRTAGEMRLSNYLLWQVSYAELYVTEALWPDFTIERFHDALRAYARRERRFGGLNAGTSSPA